MILSLFFFVFSIDVLPQLELNLFLLNRHFDSAISTIIPPVGKSGPFTY